MFFVQSTQQVLKGSARRSLRSQVICSGCLRVVSILEQINYYITMKEHQQQKQRRFTSTITNLGTHFSTADSQQSQVMDFLDNLKDNKRALHEFMGTMHGTLTRNKISLNHTTITSQRDSSHQRNGSIMTTQELLMNQTFSEMPVGARKKAKSSDRLSNIAMWKGCLNPKDYYTKYIKEQNKGDFQRQKLIQEKTLSIIHKFDSTDNEAQKTYDKNVEKYMRLLSIQDGTLMPPVKQPVIEREQVNQAAFIKVKELITTKPRDRSPIKALEAPKPFKPKVIPRYMQANQAWLTKDKNSSHHAESTMGGLNRSRRASFMPKLTMNRQKSEISRGLLEGGQHYYDFDEEFKHDALHHTTVITKPKKHIVFNRDDLETQENFKRICQERKDLNVHRARLTKGKLKALLSRKYKGKVAEKILQLFSSDMNTALEFTQWLDLLESLLNFKRDKLLRMAFNVFDFNEDNGVCQPDMFALMKLYENDDEVFIKAYSHDFCKLVAALESKQRRKGKEDFEIKQRLKSIEKKVKKVLQLRIQKLLFLLVLIKIFITLFDSAEERR